MTTITALVYYISIIVLIPLLQQISLELYNKQALNHQHLQLSAYDGMLNRIFDINIRQLEIISTIYNQAYTNINQSDSIVIDPNSQMDFCGTNPIPNLLINQPLNSGLNKSHSFFCYCNKTSIQYPLNKIQGINLKLQETFYPIGQILDATNLNIKSLFYVGFTEKPQIFLDYPCTHFGTSFAQLDIQNRPWFKLGMAIYNKTTFRNYDYQFTDPFLQFTKDKMEVTVVMPLINRNLEFKGVVASDLGTDFNKFITSSDQQVYQVILADSNGLLIYHGYEVDLSKLPIYIYNSSITGFTKEDWHAITETNESNCSTYPKKSKILCRYNSKYDKELIISQRYLPQFKYRFLIFHDITEYTNYELTMIEQIRNMLYDCLLEAVEFYCIVYAIISLIAFIIISALFRPIKIIQLHCQDLITNRNYYRHSKQIKKINYAKSSCILNPQFHRLLRAYNSIIKKCVVQLYQSQDNVREFNNQVILQRSM